MAYSFEFAIAWSKGKRGRLLECCEAASPQWTGKKHEVKNTAILHTQEMVLEERRITNLPEKPARPLYP